MTQSLNRKRPRSAGLEDECSEFVPLSKRINNLHINATGIGLIQPESSGPAAVLPSSSTNESTPRRVNPSEWEEYRPSMCEKSNPHYYQSNKLLYELYVQRVNRGTQRHF